MKNKKHCCNRVGKVSLSSAILLSLLLGGQVFAADNIVVDSGTATGTTNTVTDDTTVRIVGTDNKVTNSKDAEIFGDENTVTDSKSQTVIGDKNSITGRNSGTVSGKQDIRTDTVSDLLIGKGNTISGNYTYMKGYESLTVIGNNNSVTAPESGIIIGDNQKMLKLRDAVIIGSMTPDEKAGTDNTQFAEKSVIVGYHATGINYGIAVGYGAKAMGTETTVTGHNSVSDKNTNYSSIYGINNKIGSGNDISMANGIVGTFNKIDSSSNSMVFGSGNRITNAVGDMTVGLGADGSDQNMYALTFHSAYGHGYTDYVSELMGEYASVNGGSVFALGNSNVSNYARDSSVIGTANILSGTETAASSYNTIAGYRNMGTNVNNVSVIGTGNKLSGESTDVVIGDYHELSGGNNNVILGSMEVKEETVTRTYTPTLKDPDTGEVYQDTPITYTFTVKTPVKTHTENISNAVMLGYNTDVTQNGGVALGAQSIASTEAGKVGYDPKNTDRTTDTTGTWKSTLAAVSVGYDAVKDADGNITAAEGTRQITHVAAGTADTDAVNVAQLKEVAANAADGNDKLKGTDSALSIDGNILKLAIEDTAGTKVTGSVKLETIASAIDTKNTIAKGSHIDYTTKANEHGGTEYTLSVVTDGKVESGNTGIVTGDTVYNETRVAKDGTYIKQSQSAADSLTALDSQVAANTTQITQNTNNITSISNEITNITSNVTSLNSQVNKLDNRVNRVGAGAAALAALHPQDYDPTAKWDFAAGYGNYKSANAVAIGAFYRPSNDLLFSVGTSMGGGENMFNAGVSVKFGSSNEYANYSKSALADVVSKQSKQLEEQSSTIESLKDQVAKQAQENNELREQVQQIMRQLSAQ